MIYNMINFSPLWKDINQCNSNTKELCNDILDELEKQGEILITADKNLNESKTFLDKSKQLIHNMSWFGWFISWIPYNHLLKNIFEKHKRDDLFIDIESMRENHIIKLENVKESNYEYDNQSEESSQLNQLEKDLNDLKWIGQKIGNQLDLHNIYIDKLNDKSKILIENTGNTIKKTRDFL